ncbi:MAG: DinB family protein [Thermoanaerobaculia bacterium]|nr:DinB family protein [Thermoanaerobaculia bacterium]
MSTSSGISAGLVGDFKQEAANSRRYLESVPLDQADWKPHDKSMALGQLAGHIAEMGSWTEVMVLQDEFDLEASGGDYQPFLPTDREQLLSVFDKNVAAFVDCVEGKDDATMTATWRMLKGGQKVMEAPRAAALRSVLIHHLIHHRGQLSVYLRLLGVPVPPIYGPTADFPDGF